ncbi:MarR family transcriptional regulator [Patescibacteria group bacterium]|nr:MarR family transcriptional regulator [Patescibacteria group bacterium]
MEKKREDLIRKLADEFFGAFRSLAPRPHFLCHGDHDHGQKGHQFGRGHMELIFHLRKHEKEGFSVKDLAKLLKVTSGAITQMVDHLVEKGFLKREEDQIDRRYQRIKFSDKAIKKFGFLRERYNSSISAAFKNLNDKELRSLIELLGKIDSPEEIKIK